MEHVMTDTPIPNPDDGNAPNRDWRLRVSLDKQGDPRCMLAIGPVELGFKPDVARLLGSDLTETATLSEQVAVEFKTQRLATRSDELALKRALEVVQERRVEAARFLCFACKHVHLTTGACGECGCVRIGPFEQTATSHGDETDEVPRG
jgi:hypothetical protein